MEDIMTLNEASLHRVPCNICGSSKERFITTQNSCRVVECMECGFVYVNPRPRDEKLKELYLNYLPEKIEDPLQWNIYMKGVFKKAAYIITEMFPKGGRLLDIGCGYGFFLSEMKARGWETYGMDVSSTAVSYASGRGLNVALGTLKDIKYQDDFFDAVTMFYVLEHLPDPIDALKDIRNILKPGGLLILRLPHTTPIVRLLSFFGINNNLYDPPFHLNDFSPAATKVILEKAGFKNICTIIGGFTSPISMPVRLVTAFFGLIAEAACIMSFGKFLLPGVAKTTIAEKQR